jgi:hypothetical protein
MKRKSVLFSLFVVAVFVGFVSVGVSHAQNAFADWGGTWFEVTVSETGKAGPPATNPLLRDEIYTNNEKATTTYLFIRGYDSETATFDVAYCTFNASTWTSQIDLDWSSVAGEPKKFLAFFSVTYTTPQGHIQTYWIPLEVKGKESNNNPGEIVSGSFKNLGGIFREVRDDEIGMGEVKFKGTFVDPDFVLTVVPEGCRVTIPNP